VSGWGPWPDPNTGDVHIVPCDRERNVLGSHVQAPNCHCSPIRLADEPHVIVHNDPERGGFNG
jgi:hypothetical protein